MEDCNWKKRKEKLGSEKGKKIIGSLDCYKMLYLVM